MSLIEISPRGFNNSPDISVGMNVSEKDEDEPPLHLFIDGEDRGVVDWEICGDEKHAYVDYLDANEELRERHLRKAAWFVIANCLHGMYEGLETVDFPNSTQEVLHNAA